MDKKVLLMILDGWGEGRQDESNVIYAQGAPYIEALRRQYPMSTLKACGEAVGLPAIIRLLFDLQVAICCHCLVTKVKSLSHVQLFATPWTVA